MKLRQILSLSLALLMLAGGVEAYAQKPAPKSNLNDRQKMRLRGPVRLVVGPEGSFRFNEQGYLVERFSNVQSYDKWGEKAGYGEREVYGYDDLNRRNLEEHYNTEGKLTYRSQMIYNTKDELVQEDRTLADGSVEMWRYYYSESGLPVKTICSDPDGNVLEQTVWQYGLGKNDREGRIRHYDRKGHMTLTRTTFDKKDQLVASYHSDTVWRDKQAYIQLDNWEYEYNKKGWLLNKEQVNSVGNPITFTGYRYHDDGTIREETFIEDKFLNGVGMVSVVTAKGYNKHGDVAHYSITEMKSTITELVSANGNVKKGTVKAKSKTGFKTWIKTAFKPKDKKEKAKAKARQEDYSHEVYVSRNYTYDKWGNYIEMYEQVDDSAIQEEFEDDDEYYEASYENRGTENDPRRREEEEEKPVAVRQIFYFK